MEELNANIRKFLGIEPEPDSDTLSEFYNVYLRSVMMLSQSWLDQIGNAMDGYWLPAFGHRSMESITRAQIQAEVNRMPIGARSKEKYLIVLSGVFNLAIKDQVIDRNPTHGIRIEDPLPVDKVALTPSQLWALYNLADHRMKVCIILGGFCGVRLGEMCGSSMAVLSKDGVLHIDQQILQFTKEKVAMMPRERYIEARGGAILTRKLKSPQSRRYIPIPKILLPELLSQNQFWILADSQGQWPLPKNLANRFKELVAKMRKIDPEFPAISMHELRHTWLTNMASHLECPDSIRLELAGKAKQGTDKDYQHPHMERKQHWQERYCELVSTSGVVKSVVKLA